MIKFCKKCDKEVEVEVAAAVTHFDSPNITIELSFSCPHCKRIVTWDMIYYEIR